MNVHWHRRDLRLADNRGLAAVDSEQTVPVFVLDPIVLDHASAPRVAFLMDALETLQSTYRKRDSELLILHGNPADCLPDLAEQIDATTLTWCRDYSGLARRRDEAVRKKLETEGIEPVAVKDAVHHEPGEITTNDGDPYKVFSYFSRKWHDRAKRDPLDPPTAAELAAIDADELEGPEEIVPSLDSFGFPEPEATVPPAGTDAARDRLEQFCEEDIFRYENRRDYPADDCCSRLSVHLKYGTIGIREVYHRTEQAKQQATDETARESVQEFQDQLAWREFYTQVLWDRPDAVTENYKQYERPIEWRDDQTALQAWKDGETGYPIVDAGMRQLREEAFVHNRVRMIVASFLTKDLLIDWREGYDWFRQKLVDHDTANDNGGWQWAASTGTDAQPYFRIFNPMTQGERYDPDATYITEYVPELDGVPAETIHSWHEIEPGARQMHAPEYPAPIVEHSKRRQQAIEMFERARGETD